jgi:hypothetical protein
MISRLLLAVGLLAVLAGCATPGPGGTTAPTASPSPGPALTLPQLKLALVDALGPLWYCDPDVYPIARGEEIDHALARWPEVVADAPALLAISARLGLDPNATFSDDQKLAVYREWKVLQAIALDSAAGQSYRFDYLAQPTAGGTQGTRSTGTIALDGTVHVDASAPASEPICPICLARGTLIETPAGGAPVEDLRIGDAAWTLDEAGRRVVATVIATGSMDAPGGHVVVHLVLADGRTVTASPGHPLADGRLLGSLRPGEIVAGSIVSSADLVAYRGGETFDLVVSGPTGTYLVDGIPLGSTLTP